MSATNPASAPKAGAPTASKKGKSSSRSGTKTEPRLLRLQVGVRPNRTTVEERVAGGSLRMLVRIDGVRVWKLLRDAKVDGIAAKDLRATRTNGRIDEEQRLEIEREALRVQLELAKGRNPWAADAPPSKPASSSQATDSPPADGSTAYTLGWLLTEALGEGGRFLGNSTHMREQRANLSTYLTRIVHAIGADVPVARLTQRHLESFWRDAARVDLDAGWRGFRATEMSVEMLLSTANWATERLDTPEHAVKSTWRTSFLRDWCAFRCVNAKDRGTRNTPRYTAEEMGRFTVGFEQRLGDARIRRAVDLAGEQRVGQAIDDCWRSHLFLEKGAHGMLIILGEGRKEGAEVDLSADQRARLDLDLSEGDLADLEIAFQKGLVSDYPLFPGRFDPVTKQRLPLDRLKPMTRRYAKRLFQEFEAACGIEHQLGRGWKGIRAWGSDSIRVAGLQVGATEDVIRMAQGWAPGSRTAEQHYRDKRREEERAQAAKIREVARHQARQALVEANAVALKAPSNSLPDGAPVSEAPMSADA